MEEFNSQDQKELRRFFTKVQKAVMGYAKLKWRRTTRENNLELVLTLTDRHPVLGELQADYEFTTFYPMSYHLPMAEAKLKAEYKRLRGML